VSLKDFVIEKDGWSLRPAILSLMTVAALQLICQLPGLLSTLLIPFLLLVYGVSLIVIPALTVYFFIKKGLRKGASAFLILLLPLLLWRPINWVADIAHIGLTTRFGVGQLDTHSESSDGTFEAYDWSVGLAISPSIFLIHDLTDEIALPLAQHTHPLSSELGFGEECAGRVKRLMTHYYVCSL
jgi:hypothetical protein